MSKTPEPGRCDFSPPSLRRIMASSEQSTEQTAVNLGIGYMHLYRVMRGVKQPSLDLVIRLAEELGCHPGDLFEARESAA